jgi:hypothetical protein
MFFKCRLYCNEVSGRQVNRFTMKIQLKTKQYLHVVSSSKSRLACPILPMVLFCRCELPQYVDVSSPYMLMWAPPTCWCELPLYVDVSSPYMLMWAPPICWWELLPICSCELTLYVVPLHMLMLAPPICWCELLLHVDMSFPYMLMICLCRWLQLAQLAKGKSRP